MDDNNTAIAEADARLAKRASLATQALRCLPSPLLARGTLATTDAFDVVISNQAVPMSIFHSSGALDVAALRSQLAPSPVGFADSVRLVSFSFLFLFFSFVFSLLIVLNFSTKSMKTNVCHSNVPTTLLCAVLIW